MSGIIAGKAKKKKKKPPAVQMRFFKNCFVSFYYYFFQFIEFHKKLNVFPSLKEDYCTLSHILCNKRDEKNIHERP